MDFYEIVVSDFEILEKENLLSGTDLKVIAKQRAHFRGKTTVCKREGRRIFEIY